MNTQSVLEPEVTGEVFDLPQGWEMRPLMHALRAVDMRHRGETIQPDQDYRLLTVKLYAKGVTLRSQVKGSQIGVAKLYRTQPGDFVMSKIDARNGAWGFIPDDLIGGMVSNDFPLFQLRPEHADPDFLTFLLSRPSARAPLVEQAIGSTGRRRVQVDDFLLMEFPFPPLPEQQAIAAALRAARAARDAAANVLEQTRELKRSLLRHLFTYGPVAVQDAAKVELKETEIGMIPVDWEVKRFGEVASIASGQVDPKLEPYASMIHVGPENIESGSGKLCAKKTAKQLGLISGKYYFTDSDILYSKIRPYLRKVAMPDFSGVCSADMYPIRNGESITREYLYLVMLGEEFTERAKLLQGRTGMPKINREQLNSIILPLADKSIQRKIYNHFRPIDMYSEFITDLDAEREILFDSMLRDLLTGRVRVPVPASLSQEATP